MKVLVLLLCLFAAVTFAQPVWQTNLDGKIRFYQTTDFGIVLTGTDNSLYAVDGQTGERLWRRKHKGLNETSITPVPNTDLVLLSLDEGSKCYMDGGNGVNDYYRGWLTTDVWTTWSEEKGPITSVKPTSSKK